MSESDTMFSERDRRCAAVQLMLSTDPSYDNRTIISTLKMQIRTVQRLRAQLKATVMVFGVLSSEGHIMRPHIFEVLLESQHQSVPGCNEVYGDPLVQSGGWWQALGVAAELGAGPQVKNTQKLFYFFF